MYLILVQLELNIKCQKSNWLELLNGAFGICICCCKNIKRKHLKGISSPDYSCYSCLVMGGKWTNSRRNICITEKNNFLSLVIEMGQKVQITLVFPRKKIVMQSYILSSNHIFCHEAYSD